MNTSNVGLVPLQQASLCLDYEAIAASHAKCPACGSGALLNVARALSRPDYAGLLCPTNLAIAEIPRKRINRYSDFCHST
jgi:hypothetical protein